MEKIIKIEYNHDMTDVINAIEEIRNGLFDFGIDLIILDGDGGYEEILLKTIKT